ncbi:N-acetyltransferase [Deinococcus cavernae]|uniref:N-acetyltransferase n=1 Tax=Deinococcus cavernae TaxID=2320857 RepID=A0A418V6U6_9DEIO|nr:GNAT family N-acetyltransferase [Deinococcus cavernae]RJF71790.1 N-acetyltransferase [Deinococcus cavernae]
MTELRKNDEKSRYEILQGGQVVGFAEFRPVGDAVMLPHTEIEQGHEGEGLGSQLAKFALDNVKTESKRVIPMCPFIAGYIRRHPEYTELVHPQQRGVFKL